MCIMLNQVGCSNRATPKGGWSSARIPILSAVQDSNFIALSNAVTRAHKRLFPDEPHDDLRTLQVIALALTDLVPLYWRDARTGERHQLTEPELAAAQFTRAVMEVLSVPKIRFEAALATLQVASLEQARVSLTLRQSPQPVTAR
jgi:hypothetical protein